MKKKIVTLFLSTFLIIQTAYAEPYVMIYLYGGTSVTYSNNLEKTGGVIDMISPDYYVVSAAGTLVEEAKIDSRFIDEIHSRGMRIVPFLSNNWDKPSGVAGLNNREALAAQVSASVYSWNLDGVDVDIQNVNHNYREAYTDFVRLLRDKMPDKEVSVAVAANPNGWTEGWHGCYDYAALAANSDYLMIMAYDESYYGSAPGAVASKSFVERSIQYALKYTTADKLVLGIPFYGRYWKDGTGGNALTVRDIEGILRDFPHTADYIEEKESVRAVVTLDVDRVLWGGRTLPKGTYEVWYDDTRAAKFKLDLAARYNLRGVGNWALGQEDTAVWDLYTAYKSPQNDVGDIPIDEIVPESPVPAPPFGDIAGHWAADSIAQVYAQGWMVGTDGKFMPEQPLTRAQAAIVLMNVAGLPDVPDLQKYYFSDTTLHPARDDIAKARYYEFVSGYADGTYRPDAGITREEFAVLIDRTFQLNLAVDRTDSPFSDVNRGRWSYDSIVLLGGNDIVSGYPDGTFLPERNITRAETAHVLAKITGYGIKTPGTARQMKLQLPR